MILFASCEIMKIVTVLVMKRDCTNTYFRTKLLQLLCEPISKVKVNHFRIRKIYKALWAFLNNRDIATLLCVTERSTEKSQMF